MAVPEDNSVTVIGESVQVRGNLSGDEDLHVLGRVEGSLELDRTLVVAESGIVKAEVSVRNAIVSGVVVGNIHASESVEITEEGRMVGDISAPRVIIVDGASFRGNVDMGDIENMPARPPRQERPKPAPIAAASSTKASPKAREELEDDEDDEEEEVEEEAPPERTKVTVKPSSSSSSSRSSSSDKKKDKPKRPSFLNPPKAKGLPKKKGKKKKKVVVKRR